MMNPFCSFIAQLTQEDVFRSISDNVSQSADSGKALPLLLGGAGVLVLLVLLGMRRNRAAVPRSLHHNGKLLREITRSVHLKPAELRQLKTMTEQPEVG